MSLNELVDRLKAWEQGAPLPTTETLPFPRVPDAERLVIAFVRMGGESVPWGVAIGRPDQAPKVFTAPDPRNRDAHAELVRAFAETLLAHVGHPRYSDVSTSTGTPSEQPFPSQSLRLRQLWTPGPTHVEMLHLLEPTHDAWFKQRLDDLLPHWRTLRVELNRAPLALEHWT